MARNDGTEEPTPRRLERARKEGMVARSHDLVSFALLLAASLALPAMVRGAASRIGAFAIAAFSGGLASGASEDERVLVAGLALVAGVVAPTALAAFAAVILLNVAQVGLRLTPKRLVPSARMLSPAANLRRIFSAQPAVEIVKAIVKLVATVVLAVAVAAGSIDAMAQGAASPLAGAAAAAGASLELVRSVAALGLVLGLVDLVRQRRSLRRRLRMTRQEVRDELREHEGDLAVKARRRRLARDLLRRTMLQEVAHADVVVANPTHVAVALRYDPGRDRAPTVVAKGLDFLASSIRERARAAGVPIVEDPPLARVIYVAARVGEPIPASLFLVVARLLAFVYRLPSLARSFETRHETRPEDLPGDLAARAWSLLADLGELDAQGDPLASRG
jgi:flagellar biosynthetic protein FlhB